MKRAAAICSSLACLTLLLAQPAEAKLLRRRSQDRAIPSGWCPLGIFMAGNLFRFTADGPSATLTLAVNDSPEQRIDDVYVVEEGQYQRPGNLQDDFSCGSIKVFNLSSGAAIFAERFDSDANGWSLSGARLAPGSAGLDGGGSLALDPGGRASVTFTGLQPGRTYVVGASWFTSGDQSDNVLSLAVDTRDPKALYLGGGRFRVDASWRTAKGATGSGQAVPLTDDTGYFWFFNAANVEVTVKVIDACGLNHRYWIFASGLTNVRVDLRITDTATGVSKTYANPQGTSFKPIQDTGALATCP